MEQTQTFTYFIQVCKDVGFDVSELHFEDYVKGEVESKLRYKGSLKEFVEKIETLVTKLTPFIQDEFLGRWLRIEGHMDVHFSGLWEIDVGFRGIGITLEPIRGIPSE